MNNVNVYCDESCHLENDREKSMVIGAIWCSEDTVMEVARRIKEIKIEHGLDKFTEIKWVKVSQSKEDFYMDILNYFFDNKDLHFRGLIIPNKAVLEHKNHNQTHDDWYYKIYFDMLKTIISPNAKYNIYLDIKDTLGGKKVQKLWNVLSNNMYDFDKDIIRKIQIIRSHEIQLVQITDLLIGALSYKYRNLNKNVTKIKIINRMMERSGYDLEKTTLLREEKFNILIWDPK